MRISVVTLFPDMLECVKSFGVTGRAIEAGLVSLESVNPREFTFDKFGSVDDRPYGGGPGMLMKPEPLQRAILESKRKVGGDPRVILLSPQGSPLNQKKVVDLSKEKALVLLAGRYEGVDERLITEEVDEELSIGDFVLSGGELAAMVVIDVLMRQIPGVLGDSHSASQDSFSKDLLEGPHYTRPEVFCGQRVPGILLSGNHEEIRRWRLKQALGRTMERRPDLIKKRELSSEEFHLLEEYFEEIS